MGGRPSWILGLSCSHNGAACLLRDDEPVVAVQEERLTREKRAWIHAGAPSRAVAYCLEAAGIGPGDLDVVVLSSSQGLDRPEARVEGNPQLAVPWARGRVRTMGHHLAHGFAAFGASGFAKAAVLVVDGAGSPLRDLDEGEGAATLGGAAPGRRETISIYRAGADGLRCVEKQALPGEAWLGAAPPGRGMRTFASLGGMYSAVAELVFGSKWEAGKVMGLAPYGRPTIEAAEFFGIGEGGELSFLDRVPRRFPEAVRWPARDTEYRDLAASTQAALEAGLRHLAGRAAGATGLPTLCYAGGVALNGIANEKVLFGPGAAFGDVYVQAAAEDSGPALGAAWYGRWLETGRIATRRLERDALGRGYRADEVRAAIAATPGVRVVEAADPSAEVAGLLAEGRVVGWFQGGSELGPRALGQRSILFDPRRPEGKELLNARVKHREAFRPFAPAVLLEEAERWFEPGGPAESPFMLRVRRFRAEVRDRVPGVVHVDGSGRLQTLTAAGNGAFYGLVRAFFERTGVPMVLNTSFNVAGEPIVESPEDALRCMASTGVDFCCIDGVLVAKVPSPGRVGGI